MRKRIPYKLMKLLIKRDDATCQYCGKKADFIKDEKVLIRAFEKVIINHDEFFIPFEPDHVIPRCKNGISILENLKLSCRKCNRIKGSKERKDGVV